MNFICSLLTNAFISGPQCPRIDDGWGFAHTPLKELAQLPDFLFRFWGKTRKTADGVNKKR